ncbi:enterotoxin A family protein [Xenorhabdus poinarii]|nr:enterotoxin A family protein [Xenorhabdus poinarii]
MRTLKVFSLLCILFLYTIQSYAQQPVDKVYRMDTRPPEEIFHPAKGGFSPWGTNDNLVEHVQGVFDREHRATASAFVSTTTDRDFAINWGRGFGMEIFYVYEIRPTANFYSVVRSLQRLYAQTGRREYWSLMNLCENQAEYVAIRGIGVTQIRGVHRFRYSENDHAYIEDDYLNNELYQNYRTEANPVAYIPTAQLPSEAITPETYCAMNLTASHRYSIRFAAKAHTCPFLKERRQCHDALSTIAFLNASFL